MDDTSDLIARLATAKAEMIAENLVVYRDIAPGLHYWYGAANGYYVGAVLPSDLVIEIRGIANGHTRGAVLVDQHGKRQGLNAQLLVTRRSWPPCCR